VKTNKRLFGFIGALLITLGCLTQLGVFASAEGVASVSSLSIPCTGGSYTVTYTGVSSIGTSSVAFTISELGTFPASSVSGSTASAVVAFPANHGLSDKYYSTNVKIDGVTVADIQNNIMVAKDTIYSFAVTPPTKTSYYVGDTVDISGAKITGVSCAAGADHGDINVTAAMVNASQLACTEVGTKTIAVNYGTASASFNVTVSALPLNTLNPPTCSPEPGTYYRTKTVRLYNNPTNSGATIYYTTNGSTPTHYSKKYTGSFDVKKDTVIKAISVKDGYADSPVAEFRFYIDLDDDDDDSSSDIDNEKWYDISHDILALKNKDTYTVSMSVNNSAVPYDVLNSVIGRDINLVLDFGSFEWQINGKDMTYVPDNRIYYNMYVRSIYDSDIASLSGSNEVLQLELDHNGDFPGRFYLKLYAGYGYAGKTLYLNYYNERTYKLEQTAYATADSYGYVTFPFTHASRYVVTKTNIAGAAASTQQSSSQAPPSSSKAGYTPPITWVYNPKTAASSSASSEAVSSSSSQIVPVSSSSSSAVSEAPVFQPVQAEKQSGKFGDYLGIILIAAGSFLCGMTIFVAAKGLKK